MEIEGDGGGDRFGDSPIFDRRNTRDEDVARIKWDAWRIDELWVIVWTDVSLSCLLFGIESAIRRRKDADNEEQVHM